ncbi:MAG TPA: hypothetical protein GXZ74_01930 [Tissierellia bacterium]|nr:hypothetical protein [Tissierellia bacterium]
MPESSNRPNYSLLILSLIGLFLLGLIIALARDIPRVSSTFLWLLAAVLVATGIYGSLAGEHRTQHQKADIVILLVWYGLAVVGLILDLSGRGLSRRLLPGTRISSMTGLLILQAIQPSVSELKIYYKRKKDQAKVI